MKYFFVKGLEGGLGFDLNEFVGWSYHCRPESSTGYDYYHGQVVLKSRVLEFSRISKSSIDQLEAAIMKYATNKSQLLQEEIK